MKKSIAIIGIIALIAVLGVCLVACIPNDYSKAEKNLKDAGYNVLVYTTVAPTALKIAKIENVEAVLTADKGEDAITMVYFKDSGSAKDSYEEVEKYYKDKDAKNKERTIKRSGKVIYIGTEAAIKAVK